MKKTLVLSALLLLPLAACGAQKPLPTATPSPSVSCTTAGGCGGTPNAEWTSGGETTPVETSEAAVEEPKLEILETRAWRDDDRYAYAVILKNPSHKLGYISEEFTVEALDADGTILDSDSTYLTVLPGQRLGWTGTLYDLSRKPKKISVRGPVEGVEASDGETFGKFTISKIRTIPDDWSTKVTGTITSDFMEDQESVNIYVLVRNAKGHIINGDLDFVDRVPGGGKAKFTVEMYDVHLQRGQYVEVYATS